MSIGYRKGDKPSSNGRRNLKENLEQNAFAREPQSCQNLEIHKISSRYTLEFIFNCGFRIFDRFAVRSFFLHEFSV